MAMGTYAVWHKKTRRTYLLTGFSAQLNGFANLQAEEPNSNISSNTNCFPAGSLQLRAAHQIPLLE